VSDDRLVDEGWAGRPGPQTFAPLTWSPAPLGPPPTRRFRKWLVAAVVVVLVAVAGGAGYLAWRNDRAAQNWRRLDLAQLARADGMVSQVQAANSRIGALSSQIGTLDGQLSSLQNQLSSVANQKEKAVDQATVLQQLLSAAGTVAGDLQQCLTATNQLQADLNSAVASGDVTQLGALQSEAAQVNSTCNQAESANQQLQTAIQNSP
jgi:chromosome segregation ATPase